MQMAPTFQVKVSMLDQDSALSCNDCDDNDPNNFPGNPEICDGQDNDCTNGADFPGESVNADQDSALSCNDCDDTDPNNFPGKHRNL